MRKSKTRNEIRRERAKTAVMAVALLVGWLLIATWMFKEWANEDFITAEEHQAYVASLKDGDN